MAEDQRPGSPTEWRNESFEGLTLLEVTPKRTRPWYKDWPLLKLNTLLLCALLTQTASGYDGSMLNGMQALPQWQKFFGTPTGSRLGAMNFGPTAGGFIAVLFSAQVCEWYGRRYPIFGGSLLVILGSVLQAAANSYGMFVGARFLIGLGLGLVSTAAPLLLTELAYPTQRGKLVSFLLVSWPLGALMAAWITFGTFRMTNSSWSWRIPSVLQCFFSIIQACLSLLTPESPRWLIYKGKHEMALEVLTKYHGDGGSSESTRLVWFEMAEITATLEIEKAQNQSRWKEWISTKGNRHRLFITLFVPIMLQWSGNALTSYYLHYVLDTIGITTSNTQLIINAVMLVWSLLTACVFALLVDKAGRRRLFLFGMGGMGIAYIIWTICSAINQEKDFKDPSYARAVLAMIFIYNAFYQMCGPIAPTYVMEVVPFSLRSKAAMMYQLAGNVVGIYNSFANPVAMEAISWRYYIVWCVVISINFTLIYFYFPETKGRGLEEIGEIFDGPGALSGTTAMKETGLDVHAENSLVYGQKDEQKGHVLETTHREKV